MTRRRGAIAVAAAVVLALGGAGWVLTGPDPVPPEALAPLTGDPARGVQVFAAAGCAACHIAPDAKPSDAPLLSGGRGFASDFGTFRAPNISPSAQGIGDWTDAEIVTAVMRGVSPSGAHYYPALPYDSYGKADLQDMVDMVAHLRRLPPSDAANLPHEVGFPFNIRRALGLWKLMFVSRDWVMDGDLTAAQLRGRYLVEALGHCGACHTARNALGGLRRDAWLAGAPHPSGKGRIPNITPGGLDWSEADIAYYLETGFTPEFDTAGAEMAEVVSNLARLPPEDRAAIASYLKIVPARD